MSVCCRSGPVYVRSLFVLLVGLVFVTVLAEHVLSAEPARSDRSSVGSMKDLPVKIQTLMSGERDRINAARSGEKDGHVFGPLRVLFAVDIDGDREEEILDDLYIARMDEKEGEGSVYVIAFWNNVLRLPGRVIRTRTWKVESYEGSLQVADVNRDGVDDYLGRIQVVPTTVNQPRTELYRRLIVSSHDEKGAFRPAHLLGKQAQLSESIPTIEDSLEE